MKTLDLHGTRHRYAEDRVRVFLNFVQLPCQIITGNSDAMKRIAKRVVSEYGWYSRERDSYNTGTLIVSEKELK